MVETTPRTPVARRGLRALGLLAICAAAIVGANVFGVRDSLFGSATPAARSVAVSPFARVGAGGTGQKTILRSQPWWQGLDRLSGGAGTTAASFDVAGSASQWRARWSCRGSHLTARAAGSTAPLIDAACPASGTAVATRPGAVKLSVTATGPWSLRIDQQVDVPLVVPPLPVMAAPGTVSVARGTFYRIDQGATGGVRIYRAGDGTYLMRLSNFYVTPNVDLEIRLSPLRAPRTTREYLSAPSTLVAPLNITAGSLNFTVPRSVDPTKFRSIVIWCPLIDSAYAGASLSQVK